jgi:hypothetical protein
MAARVGGEQVGEVVEKRAPLSELELAVDDRAAQAALGSVVGRLHAGDGGEGPERRPELERVVGEAPDELVALAFAASLEERLEFALERRDLAHRVQASVSVIGRKALAPDDKQESSRAQKRYRFRRKGSSERGVRAAIARHGRSDTERPRCRRYQRAGRSMCWAGVPGVVVWTTRRRLKVAGRPMRW